MTPRSGLLWARLWACCAGGFGASCSTLLGADTPVQVELEGGAADVRDGGTETSPGAGSPTGRRVVAGNLLLPQPLVDEFAPGFNGRSPVLVTSDGYVPYLDMTDQMMKVVSLTPGSTPVPIAPFSSAPSAGVTAAPSAGAAAFGQTLILCPTVDMAGNGPLYTFSAATGAKQVFPATTALWPVVSADGTRLANYVLNQGATQASLVLTDVDGSNALTLIPSFDLTAQCFAGSGAAQFVAGDPQRVLALWCPPGGTPSTLSLFTVSGSTFSRLDLAPNIWNNPLVDQAGKLVAFVPNGTGGGPGSAQLLFDLSTGATTTIETQSSCSCGFSGWGFFAGTGANETLHYSTTIGHHYANVNQPQPATAFSGTFPNAFVLLPPSPDGSHTLGLVPNNGAGGDSLFDVLLSPLVAGKPGITLDSTWTGSISSDFDYFTADSSHAMWLEGLNGAGTFRTIDVSGGSPIDVASNANWIVATSGAKVVAQVNVVENPDTTVTGDMVLADLSSPTPVPRTLVSKVGQSVTLTPDRKQLLYTTYVGDHDAGSPYDGLWIMPAP